MPAGAELPLVTHARAHAGRTAIQSGNATFTYRDLLDASASVAACLLGSRPDLNEARVAFLVPAGFPHVAVQWGIWRAGGIAVPLAVSHPAAELAYVIRDADAAIVVVDPELAVHMTRVELPPATRTLSSAAAIATAGPTSLPNVAAGRRAMMVYTSGTTGKPKGVVTTHAHLAAQVTSLVTAWEWCTDDVILLVLPLHHVHGIVNVLACALWAGAGCEMHAKFEAERVWSRIAAGGLTLFMAVPTIYHKLIAAWEAAPAEQRRAWSRACRGLRLMVSGSAALPVQTLERWREISGHTLLERYGMTEIGMALSNPLHGERRPGFVGTPLPGVEVRVVSDTGAPVGPGTPGEIEVRGPGVFLEYWRQPEATAAAFRHGWFRTGDVAILESGAYKILGRQSVDIIKTAGYKISALEIEEVLRTHPAVQECAVVGVLDPEWGERVSVAVEVRGAAELTLPALQAWAKERLAPYKIPRALRCVAALPRNVMGKVTKRDVAALFRDGWGLESRLGPTARIFSSSSLEETGMPETFPRGRFVWHELMTTDPDAAVRFYTQVIGWKSQPWEHDPSYRLWTMGTTLKGGLMRLSEDARRRGAPPSWVMYVAVPDVDATVRQATALGARTSVPPTTIPVGRFAVLADPQGATVAVYKPGAGQGMGSDDAELGDFSWHELATTSPAAAWDFYHALFGWDKSDAMDMGAAGVYQMYGRAGRMLGGIYAKPREMAAPSHWLCYVKVPSVDTTAAVVTRLGGRVTRGPMDVPGGSRIVMCVDPQGAMFALHSFPPAPARAKAAPTTKPKPKPKAKPKKPRRARATAKARPTKRRRPVRKRRR